MNDRDRRKRERQQAALEALEAETQAANAAMKPFDDDVARAKDELRASLSPFLVTAIDDYIDAKLRRAAFKLGLDPDKLW